MNKEEIRARAEREALKKYPVEIIGYTSSGPGPCDPVDANARDREKFIQGFESGYSAAEGMRWVKLSTKFPEDWTETIIRHRVSKRLIIEENVKSANPEYFEMEDGETIYYSECEYLDESPPSIDIEALWEEMIYHQIIGTHFGEKEKFITIVNKLLGK